MTNRRLLIAAATLAGLAPLTACLPGPPAPKLPPLIQDGACAHTTDMRNRSRCVIYTDTRRPGFWIQGPAWDAYFQVSHGTAKIVKDPS